MPKSPLIALEVEELFMEYFLEFQGEVPIFNFRSFSIGDSFWGGLVLCCFWSLCRKCGLKIAGLFGELSGLS